ncbi:PilZ domain-containing protein [uncultured Hyphomonas sp.]|uniref:PilZ domain-containing protein n=1 Tax=uncultured Hyphomonas sp. TaxID=225298 RepID=UPI002AABAFAC|nr:PilZ domain-containing protein [uncultured Hyphomonas sp.]
MTVHVPRRNYRRHSSARDTRLRPKGYRTWIEASMIDWSAAGASLSGPVETVPLGLAVLAVSPMDGTSEIHLSCEVIWREKGKVGLKLLGPVSH